MRVPAALPALVVTLAVSLAAPSPATSAPAPGSDRPARSDPSLRSLPREPIGAAQLRSSLDALARQAPGASGFQVVELANNGNEALFSREEARARKLASNMKLFTTAAALDRLGAKERIETTVQHSGRVDRHGVLNGNLYLVGGGDPTLGGRGIRVLATAVLKSGIERVSGDLIGDDTIFDRKRGVPDSNYEPGPYLAPLAGLVYEGSTYDLNPARETTRALARKLGKKGVSIEGKARLGSLPRTLELKDPTALHSSPPIEEIIAATNKVSDNFIAEMLAKLLATLTGKQGTTDAGAIAIEGFARSVGSGVVARDGSGLTDGNRSSPRNVVRLLDAMRSHPDGPAYYASLPIAGQDGTLSSRMNGTAADGDCRAKTGTINFVSTLSGYCELSQGRDGDLVGFSILMNGVASYDAARDIQDRMVIEIARYEPR